MEDEIEVLQDDLEAKGQSALSATQAIELFDRSWYTGLSHRGRWMDLIGDYAGKERFILDGESLFRYILDDPLLAIARVDNPSFQIIHACYLLERTLSGFLKRKANFEIVFFHATRHATLRTGETRWVATSRALARKCLFRHVFQLNVPTHVFNDLDDTHWHEYVRLKKPMFVMADDGGSVEGARDLAAERVLLQREFVFKLLAQGIAMTLLSGSEFRDSKIMAYVYERRRMTDAHRQLPIPFWDALLRSTRDLEARQAEVFGDPQRLQLRLSSGAVKKDAWLADILRHLGSGLSDDRNLEGITYLFLAHSLALEVIPLADRAQPLQKLHRNLERYLCSSGLPDLYLAILAAEETASSPPDIDGRVFLRLMHLFSSQTIDATILILGPQLVARLKDVYTLSSLKAPDLHRFISDFPGTEMTTPGPKHIQPSLTVLPFHNSVFNEHLAAVHVEVESEQTALVPHGDRLLGEGILFEDIRLWHNTRTIMPKRLGGEDLKKPDERQRRKRLRADQFFMASLQKQAITLTGALGAPLQQQVIPSVKSRPDKNKGASSRAQIVVRKTKVAHVSAADKIRLNNQADKQKKADQSSTAWWKQQLKELEKLTAQERANRLEHLMRNKKCEEGFLFVEVRLYRMHLRIHAWIEHSQRDSDAVRDAFTVSLVRMAKDLIDHGSLSVSAHAIVKSVLNTLGLSGYAGEPAVVVPSGMDVAPSLSFEFVKLLKKAGLPIHRWMCIREDPVAWQLRLFGEYMDRSMDSKADSRVAFHPDAWQRDVLDSLDREESILVVAPTSAGKTFISFYAMEKVLKASDDGILVYIAPTKALVTQIAAEIYARFRKDLDGRSCWAVHTRDNRVHDPLKCQILVTVPEMFAIMLLSPTLAPLWTPRIKRIILDEIHSIGQQEGGAVWEQILLLAPCPIIGLSATIGEPEEFNGWLSSVQQSHGFKHTFIQHPHRYSHLRKFFYRVSSTSKKFKGLADHDSTGNLRFLHPISALAFGPSSLPPDLALEPLDLLSLFEALKIVQGELADSLDTLEPSRYFPGGRFLRQEDVLKYEKALKSVLEQLMTSPNAWDEGSALQKIIRVLEDPVVAGLTETEQNSAPDRQAFLSGLMNLIGDLDRNGDLPALLFSFDRHHCETMARYILISLEEAEEKWRKISAEWQGKLVAVESWKAGARMRERAAERAKKQKKDGDEEQDTPDVDWRESFDPDDPSAPFTLTGVTRHYSLSELKDDISRLKWTSVSPWLFAALKRGVGVHHSGMNKGYRSLVESLFRLGFLRIVISTGTLALGINAPTKTAVFCGDSPFLTALMYRQCAGRAGRRGYDLLGKVIFYGLPLDRVQRLVLSKLPSLGGNFPLTSTLCLRLFNLLEGSNHAPVAVNAINSLMNLPRVSFGSDAGKEQLLHHLRFSIDYLMRSRLLNDLGQPMNLFGVAAHLYYAEPSNLALVALFRSGVFHHICGQTSFLAAQQEFMLVMCHLFGRRYLPRSAAGDHPLMLLRRKYPSRIILPPMPEPVRKVLVKHNDEIRGIFTSYALTFAEQHSAKLGSEYRLPLSQISVVSSNEDVKLGEGIFAKSLHETAIQVVARSIFVANSGHGDHFDNVTELGTTCRGGLHLNEHAIPSLDSILVRNSADRREIEPFVLNAYLLDFYMHGDVNSLDKANGIRRGDIWYLLQDFTLVLVTIQSAILQLLTGSSDEDEADTVEDSGYSSLLDPAERDGGEDEGGVEQVGDVPRPANVSDADWRVYEVVESVTKDFDAKFRAMWA